MFFVVVVIFNFGENALGHGSTCNDRSSSSSKLNYLSHAFSKLNLVLLRPKEASYLLLAQAYQKRRSFRLLRCQRGHLQRGASGNGERRELLSHVVSARVGSPPQARPYQRRVFFVNEHIKVLIQLFMKGEEMKSEKKARCSNPGANHQHPG